MYEGPYSTPYPIDFGAPQCFEDCVNNVHGDCWGIIISENANACYNYIGEPLLSSIDSGYMSMYVYQKCAVVEGKIHLFTFKN